MCAVALGAVACSTGTTELAPATSASVDAVEDVAALDAVEDDAALSTSAVPLLLDIPSGMTWQQMIDAIAGDSELSCIDDLLGDQLPGELLDITVRAPAASTSARASWRAGYGELVEAFDITETEPVGWPVVKLEPFDVEAGDRWPHELWQCLAPATAAVVYSSVVFAEIASMVESYDADVDCIERVGADADLAAAVAQRLSREKELGDDAFGLWMFPLFLDFAASIDSCIDTYDDDETGPENGVAEATGICDPAQDTASTADEIYAAVAPSIPYIETPVGSGSGILIEGGYVLTNHHVVWPLKSATVVFPDGAEYVDVPLAATDPSADIALIGPLETGETPLLLVDGEQKLPGSDVYLIGYPAEYEYAPTPSITSGVLSRVRHWEGYDLTLLQTDSAITNGQSGGALLDGRGCVIGVSTWSWTDANFTVSTSAWDIAQIIDLLLDGDGSYFSYGDRIGDDADTAAEHTADAWDPRKPRTFLARTSDPGGVTVELFGAPGAGLWVADLNDVLADVTDGLPRRVVTSASSAFVAVGGIVPGSSFTLSSNGLLVPYHDEDGTALWLDDFFGGVFDYYGDSDLFLIDLAAGDAVRIWTDSIGTDTYLLLYDEETQIVAEGDDNGPAAVFGTQHNAEIHFEAPASGTFVLEVGYHAESSISHDYLLFVEAIK